MIMIVAHHFAGHSGFPIGSNAATANWLWLQFLLIGGKIGVNIFVLISGYFLVSAKSIQINKVIKLWLQVFLYSVVFYGIFAVLGPEPFRIRDLPKILLPISSEQWWFASTYFVLYILTPYINRLLGTLDQKQYQRFLLLLGVCWCIIPTFTENSFQGNNLLWFAFLYSVAGYFRLFGFKSSWSGAKCLALAFFCTIVTFFVYTVLKNPGIKLSVLRSFGKRLHEMYSLPSFVISALLFLGFSRINIRHNRLINWISSATFGVYLIHDNEYVRPFLWKTALNNAAHYESSTLIPYSLLVIATVFVVCTMIELIRIHLFEKFYLRLTDKLLKAATAKLESRK